MGGASPPRPGTTPPLPPPPPPPQVAKAGNEEDSRARVNAKPRRRVVMVESLSSLRGATESMSLRRRLRVQSERSERTRSSRLEHEIDPHGIEREHDPAIVALLQNAGIEQGMRVSMHPLDVPLHPAGRFAQGDGAGAGQRREQLPTLLGQHLEQQRRRL